MAFHGYPRFTGDVDFFIDATPKNARRVLQVLEDFGFGIPAIRGIQTTVSPFASAMSQD